MSYAEALRRIAKAKEVKAIALDLSGLNLKEIPSKIDELNDLVVLDLSNFE